MGKQKEDIAGVNEGGATLRGYWAKDGVKQDNDCQDNGVRQDDGVRQDKDSIEVTEEEIKRAKLQGSRNSGCHLKSKSVQTSCRHSLVNNEFSLDPNLEFP